MSSPALVGASGKPLAPSESSPKVELAQVHPLPRIAAARLLAGLPAGAKPGTPPLGWRLEIVLQTGLSTGKVLTLDLVAGAPGRALAATLRDVAAFLDQLADDCAPAPQDAVSAATAELEPGA